MTRTLTLTDDQAATLLPLVRAATLKASSAAIRAANTRKPGVYEMRDRDSAAWRALKAALEREDAPAATVPAAGTEWMTNAPASAGHSDAERIAEVNAVLTEIFEGDDHDGLGPVNWADVRCDDVYWARLVTISGASPDASGLREAVGQRLKERGWDLETTTVGTAW